MLFHYGEEIPIGPDVAEVDFSEALQVLSCVDTEFEEDWI